MTKKKRIILLIIIVISILAIAICGFIIHKNLDKNINVVANGVVVEKTNKEYKNTLVKSYEELDKLLKEYDVKDVVLFTNKDFLENDYIVDFIEYDDGIKIKDIDLLIENDGIVITYTVDKEIKDGTKKLMYFIPVTKNLLDDVIIKSRSFEVK